MAKKKTDFFANVQNRQQENMREIETNQYKGEQIVGMSMRVPENLRRKMRQHYAQTGESMNALIIRLLENEFTLTDERSE